MRKISAVALEANGIGVKTLGTAAFASQIIAERARFGGVIQKIGLKMN